MLTLPTTPARFGAPHARAAGHPMPGDAAQDDFAEAILDMLTTRPRAISPKYFYDERGSALFERICELPEYYPTRTEAGLLQRHADDIAGLMGAHCEIVEYGAGALRKVRLLLAAADRPARYLPIDISTDFLRASAATLRRQFAGLDVVPLAADFTRPFDLPAPRGPGRRIGFFPGSTLGNFTPDEALRFLRLAARQLQGGALLLGADLVKDPAVLHAAYNDSQGVTAAFNLNLLHRANRELGTGFEPGRFVHAAFYNAPLRRVEMHLVSKSRQAVQWAGRRFDIAEGETLHTENSHKFTVEGLQQLARAAGLQPRAVWTDPHGLFSLHWLDAPPFQDDAGPALNGERSFSSSR